MFDEYDADGSGAIEYREYVRHTLRSALARSFSRVIDLFHKWDRDGSGTIDKRELSQGIKACGFDAPKGARAAQEAPRAACLVYALLRMHACTG